jgi:hypothetical protein
MGMMLPNGPGPKRGALEEREDAHEKLVEQCQAAQAETSLEIALSNRPGGSRIYIGPDRKLADRLRSRVAESYRRLQVWRLCAAWAGQKPESPQANETSYDTDVDLDQQAKDYGTEY